MTAFIQEPSRDIPVLGEYDVVVCGGGQLEKDRDVESAFETRGEE